MSSPSPAPRCDGLPSRWHVLLHALVVGGGWLLFVYCWWLVLQQPRDTGTLRELIVGATIVMPLLTLAWIVHNVGIHRRKGPRRAGAPVPLVYEVDFNGRRIDADWPTLQRQRRVDIELAGDVKHYRAGAVPRDPPRPPAPTQPADLAPNPVEV